MMKRPKMNAYERLMYRMDTTSGNFIYCKIQFGKLFREMGLYKLQELIKRFVEDKLGLRIMFKSELPSKPLSINERHVIEFYNNQR